MPLVKAVINWSEKWQKNYKVPRGMLLLAPKQQYKSPLVAFFKKLNILQRTKEELRDLTITIEYHYGKRTLSQNNLMWALYTIIANETNGVSESNGVIDREKKQLVSPETLYEQDLLEQAPRMVVIAKPEMLSFVKQEYRILEQKKEGKHLKLKLLVSTSNFDTKQMSYWIKMLFERIGTMEIGVDNSYKIRDYWIKWKDKLNKDKIIFYNEDENGKISRQQYKELNPLCEATGQNLTDGTGQLSHIKAVGMGGNPEPEKDLPHMWLHLCTEAHIFLQHQKGWGAFLKEYPFLTYKIEKALNKKIV